MNNGTERRLSTLTAEPGPSRLESYVKVGEGEIKDKEVANTWLTGGYGAIAINGYFELLMMILGTSVPFVYAKWNMIQIVFHFLSCLFLLWFILDTWNYIRIWYIFTLTSAMPFALEIVMLRQAALLKKVIKHNRERI